MSNGVDSIPHEVATKVAEAENNSPMEIKELHKIIDPDALEDLTSSNSSVRVKFRYEGHEVIVQEGDVTLQE
ncbi:HalOD1 output domain-containing protein [Halobellus marinus]|jgi:hypothetical protein|uniref:HalOD1 output domain-containing protein n=1 Tax=Halobellus sp. GCM10025813 TaxID=3252665 RepID=UPI00361F4BE7